MHVKWRKDNFAKSVFHHPENSGTMQNIVYALLLAIVIPFTLAGQSVSGLWQVDHVSVGDRQMTPIAKWFEINDDLTYTAGNGWSRNDIGTLRYNAGDGTLLPDSERNGPDTYGPFSVTFSGDEMVWSRDEDGMPVVVTLSRIEDLPMSPKDSIVGNWSLVQGTNQEGNTLDTSAPEHYKLLEIRWTETFRATRQDNAQVFGYWHMDAHAPEFHLVNFETCQEVEIFDVAFEENSMVMLPRERPGTRYVYTRQ